jgi:hypothetical protein
VKTTARLGWLVLIATVVATACGAPAGPNVRPAGSTVVTRVRFDDDRVTCYVATYAGMSCLRDAQ